MSLTSLSHHDARRVPSSRCAVVAGFVERVRGDRSVCIQLRGREEAATYSETMARVRIGRIDSLPVGRPVLAVAGGRRLAVVRTADGRIHVLDDSCPHAGGPLSEGAVLDGKIICPYHTWFFDLKTGHCVEGRATERVPVYPAGVDGDHVWVEVPDLGGATGG